MKKVEELIMVLNLVFKKYYIYTNTTSEKSNSKLSAVRNEDLIEGLIRVLNIIYNNDIKENFFFVIIIY